MTNRMFKSGVSREQSNLLPARVDDYVAADNAVRAIDAYVRRLDLEQLGFRHAGPAGDKGGQPPYDPADMLKLYIYGYSNRVRSSRRLEQEAQRNLEVIWLLNGLTPGYRTIANFRKDNWAALKAASRYFVLLAHASGLMSGELVAIDGAFFHGDASKASIKTREKLARQIAALDKDIEAYRSALEANDTAETQHAPAGKRRGGGDGDGSDAGEKLAALMARHTQAKADLGQLGASGETQLSRTDPDARLLTKNSQSVAGYNVQIAVDSKHKLIAASEVVNDGNDAGQLYEMADAAKQALAVETLTVVADAGYCNGATLKQCEENGIVAYVPEPERRGRLAAKGYFSHEDFAYDAAQNVYRCPAGALLYPTKQLKQNGGRQELRYLSRKAVCRGCPLRASCISTKSGTRTIARWVDEEVLDRHRVRMRETNAGDMMRQRACLAEHPFGTLKCRAGYRHFLLRGLNKVRGEWSLMALCYNFTRMLNILGFDGFMAARLAA